METIFENFISPNEISPKIDRKRQRCDAVAMNLQTANEVATVIDI